MFNAREFLRQNFQNAGGVIAHCRAMGVEPPSEEAAQKWFERNSLTGEWLAKLLFILESERGKPVSIRDYIGAMA
jgi:hypothetical protein